MKSPFSAPVVASSLTSKKPPEPLQVHTCGGFFIEARPRRPRVPSARLAHPRVPDERKMEMLSRSSPVVGIGLVCVAPSGLSSRFVFPLWTLAHRL